MRKRSPLGIKILTIYFLIEGATCLFNLVSGLADPQTWNLSQYGTFGTGVGGFLGILARQLIRIVLGLMAGVFLLKRKQQAITLSKVTFLVLGLYVTGEIAHTVAGGVHAVTYVICFAIFGVVAYRVIKYLGREDIRKLFPMVADKVAYFPMTKPPSPRPLSIKVIVSLYIFGVIACIVGLGQNTIFFGQVISESLASLYLVIYILIGLLLAFGLWRLKEMARRVAIALELFGVLDGIVTSVRFVNNPSIQAKYFKPLAEDLRSTVNSPEVQQEWAKLGVDIVAMEPGIIAASSLFTVMIIGVSAVGSLLVIWFLIKRKSAFGKPVKTTP